MSRDPQLQAKIIYAPPRVWAALEQEAKLERRSFRDWVLMLLERHVDEPRELATPA